MQSPLGQPFADPCGGRLRLPVVTLLLSFELISEAKSTFDFALRRHSYDLATVFVVANAKFTSASYVL
ncbi:MAG: hypothetical protein O3B68_17130, partial [Planctomycetota bacterium]|nr:hypothetical protein [Planctomycetota bacterium]